MELVIQSKPHQVTLVPDAPDAITSNAGWDVETNFDFLSGIVKELKAHGIRVSIFMEANPVLMKRAAETGTDRVELYTESYAVGYSTDKEKAVAPFIEAAKAAHEAGLGINAGHDLNLENLKYFAQQVPYLNEVSIGHALISDALYFGLENTVQMYKNELR
jgi:pyridoxine 5-phosphate synthase